MLSAVGVHELCGFRRYGPRQCTAYSIRIRAGVDEPLSIRPWLSQSWTKKERARYSSRDEAIGVMNVRPQINQWPLRWSITENDLDKNPGFDDEAPGAVWRRCWRAGTGQDAPERSQTGPEQRWRVRWGPGVWQTAAQSLVASGTWAHGAMFRYFVHPLIGQPARCLPAARWSSSRCTRLEMRLSASPVACSARIRWSLHYGWNHCGTKLTSSCLEWFFVGSS